MATVVFWCSILLGIPILVAELGEFLLLAVLELGIGERAKRIPDWLLAVPTGVLAMAVAGMLARWLLGEVSASVPLALAAIAAIWQFARAEFWRAVFYALGIYFAYRVWF